MHLKTREKQLGPAVVDVKFLLEDPEPLTGHLDKELDLKASVGESLLEVAMRNGIGIEHACGGVCACSTCHVHVLEGEELCNEPEDDELDRVDEAPLVDETSRLSCQAVIEREGKLTVEVPGWNRNAVKEVPH